MSPGGGVLRRVLALVVLGICAYVPISPAQGAFVARGPRPGAGGGGVSPVPGWDVGRPQGPDGLGARPLVGPGLGLGPGQGRTRGGRDLQMIFAWKPDPLAWLRGETPGSSSSGGSHPVAKTATVVLLAGFEAFNLVLYRKAADRLLQICPNLRLIVYTDQDVVNQPDAVAAALAEADVFFGSLIFDFDQVTWLRERIERVPTRFVFESALELMALTQVGSFTMAGGGGEGSGPPPAVKALLSKFGSKKEEDRLKGYLNFLKVGPSILRLVPGQKAYDIRTWLEVYSYWNQGGIDNVVSLFLLLARRLNLLEVAVPEPRKVVETPGQGLVHPLHSGYFASPRKYLEWYLQMAKDESNNMAPAGAPRVAVLLYRKHVITSQLYISQLIRIFEREGLLPVPIFINGVEAHTIVRDLLTTEYERGQRAKGVRIVDSLSAEAIEVDAIVNTIGFPLVGGPAGSMEAGRRVDVATRLLAAKNVPYFVSSPLLIQDIKSWKDNGVVGLQSAVLYSLPELDGAVDTVVLGGLAGDKIALVPERVRKLSRRIKGWHRIHSTSPTQRKVAVLLYGFPPNVGAIGTAALLNVPRSLENLLKSLQAAGYDTGIDADKIDGEAIIAVLTAISQDSVVSGGPERMFEMVEEGTFGGESVLKQPATCVPMEGVLRCLCSVTCLGPETRDRVHITAKAVPTGEFRKAIGDRTADRIEKMWGDLDRYVGLFTSQKGELIVGGVQLGNVWVGVQPLLGIEGDPMRLMFERDLTPHPQYVAFYDWMRKDFGAQAVIHFGMHGTAEWLPGSPLGNTAETWPDILMGDIPNVYVYAANNPSESILAKRRGYGTIVSHNVPAYSRAGLYKDLAQLKELVYEYRENPEGNGGLRPVIAGVLDRTGLYEDCPYHGGKLTAEQAEGVDQQAFDAYLVELTSYLGTLENRLFSEGLHVLGEPPKAQQVGQYLDAYFDKSVPAAAIEAISHLDTSGDPRTVLTTLQERLASVPLQETVGDLLADLEDPPFHWYNSLSNEEKYSLSLAGVDLLRFYFLKIRRALGDQEAAQEIREEVVVAMGEDQGAGMSMEVVKQKREDVRSKLLEGIEIKKLLNQNTEELHSIVKALNGEYILPGVGGDLLRDGTGVLPTGRNIHALDPYRLPSPGAWER
jgi:magnesium chelatase subunit H